MRNAKLFTILIMALIAIFAGCQMPTGSDLSDDGTNGGSSDPETVSVSFNMDNIYPWLNDGETFYTVFEGETLSANVDPSGSIVTFGDDASGESILSNNGLVTGSPVVWKDPMEAQGNIKVEAENGSAYDIEWLNQVIVVPAIYKTSGTDGIWVHDAGDGTFNILAFDALTEVYFFGQYNGFTAGLTYGDYLDLIEGNPVDEISELGFNNGNYTVTNTEIDMGPGLGTQSYVVTDYPSDNRALTIFGADYEMLNGSSSFPEQN